jgi:hypothetical protein
MLKYTAVKARQEKYVPACHKIELDIQFNCYDIE